MAEQGRSAKDHRGRVLLHVCCGPCAVFPVQALRAEGFEVHGFWYNPNIHPLLEYIQRRDSARRMAAIAGLSLIEEDEYGLERFLGATFPDRVGRGERCSICYRMRLGRTAEAASEGGFERFTTTLLVSPYQDHKLLVAVGEQEAAAHGVQFLVQDFRQGFAAGRQKSREMGLYQQQYCGCVFSEGERYRSKHTGRRDRRCDRDARPAPERGGAR